MIHSLSEDIKRISSELELTSQILMTLEFIQKAGLIESARLSDGSIFNNLFQAIMNLIKESKIVYAEFSGIINTTMKNSVNDAITEYQEVSGLWNECQNKILV